MVIQLRELNHNRDKRMSTIFALSSGSLPCAIAIIRISGEDIIYNSCLKSNFLFEALTVILLSLHSLADQHSRLIDFFVVGSSAERERG